MSDDWKPQNAPNVKQDFNEAAKQQVKQNNPPPSEKGIATKAELEKRTEQERIIRERLQRENAPKLQPKNEIAKNLKAQEFNKDRKKLEENNSVKERIRQQLENAKKQEMSREFNRVADVSRD